MPTVDPRTRPGATEPAPRSPGHDRPPQHGQDGPPHHAHDTEETLHLRLPAARPSTAARPPVGDPRGWGPADTSYGRFALRPVLLERDLPLLGSWMNDPVVAAFWLLAGPDSVTAAHVRAQLAGDGRSIPCLGLLDGEPMSYFEVYRADLDPLAQHYAALPQDIGVHLLLGRAADRGRGLGSALLRAVGDLVLAHCPACPRLVAEPDVRNAASVAAFTRAGFRAAGAIELPDKRAAFMIRER